MKTFILNDDFNVCIVDNEDFNRIIEFKWFYDNKIKGATIKSTTKIDGNYRQLSNFIIQDYSNLYDHIDNNIFNNQKNNLRKCTHQQNSFNKERYSNNTSGYKGVSYFKSRNKWRAYIKITYRFIHLGYFNTKEEAALAYNKAAKYYFEEFANLNKL